MNTAYGLTIPPTLTLVSFHRNGQVLASLPLYDNAVCAGEQSRLTFENVPTNFKLVSDVPNLLGRWVDRSRNFVAEDARGLRVSISPENLFLLLTHSGYDPASGFKSQLVYGIDNSRLCLISVDSPEYRLKFANMYPLNSGNNLPKLGRCYWFASKQSTVVYIGQHVKKYVQIAAPDSCGNRLPELLQHVFWCTATQQFMWTSTLVNFCDIFKSNFYPDWLKLVKRFRALPEVTLPTTITFVPLRDREPAASLWWVRNDMAKAGGVILCQYRDVFSPDGGTVQRIVSPGSLVVNAAGVKFIRNYRVYDFDFNLLQTSAQRPLSTFAAVQYQRDEMLPRLVSRYTGFEFDVTSLTLRSTDV